MNSLSLQPYIGNDEFITIISCDEDISKAERILRKPFLDGYRIWFDNSDMPETEKSGALEKNIKESSACIALLSGNAVNSHYFRSGLTFAVNIGRPVILVFTEDIPLSVCMQIQAQAAVKIEKYNLLGEEFYNKLYSIPEIRKCRDTRQDKVTTMWLEREKTKDIIVLKSGATTFGRHSTMCDYVIDNNNYVGRVHATIINSDKKCVIIDNNSKNKTYVNSRMLMPEQQFRLYDGDVVSMATEKFIFHQS